MIPIEVTASAIKHLGSNQYYIRHIFNALREHKELLDSPDYKRLYDEALDFLFRHTIELGACSDTSEREEAYGWLEFLADLNNTHDDSRDKFSIETVDFFLAQRRKIWNA